MVAEQHTLFPRPSVLAPPPAGVGCGVSPQGWRRALHHAAFAMDVAGASASTLADTARTPRGQAVFGPCLQVDMGEPALIAALNAWGSARDREVDALRSDLATTKAVVEMTFDQAQAGVSATLLGII